jgi:hypothetical protein
MKGTIHDIDAQRARWLRYRTSQRLRIEAGKTSPSEVSAATSIVLIFGWRSFLKTRMPMACRWTAIRLTG